MTQQTFPTPSYGQPYGTPAGSYGPPPGPQGYQQPRKRRTGAIVGGIVAAVVVVAGAVVGALLLFGTKYIDDAKVEDGIGRLTQDNFGVAASDASCPTGIEVKSGGTFRCTATVDGQHATFTVTQKNDKGDVGIVTDDAYAPVSDIEDGVSSKVSADAGVDVTTSCEADGHTVLVFDGSTDVHCTASNADDPSDSAGVTATVAADGSITVKYDQQ
jgi:hypothetical protein